MKLKTLAGYLAATIGVALATELLWLLRFQLDNAHVGLVYLLLVAIAAVWGGTRPALIAALLSFLAWDFFFLPPYYTFTVRDPRDWLLLLVFLGIGVLMGQMTGRLRLREEEAVAREKDTEALYRASLAVGTETHDEEVLATLVEQIVLHTRAAGCAIMQIEPDGSLRMVAQSGEVTWLDSDESRALLRRVVGESKAVGLPPVSSLTDEERAFWPFSVPHQNAERTDVMLPLVSRERSFGVLCSKPRAQEAFRPADSRLFVAFASHAATFLERRRLREEAASASRAQEVERLKSVLLSSISHNLKTPVASLQATLSSLRQGDIAWNDEVLSESFDLMAEDVERLTEHIENLLSLAQLESGWTPQRERVEMRELVEAALRLLSDKDYQRVDLTALPDETMLYVDLVQMGQVLRHLVENALTYSPTETRVCVGAASEGRQVRFWVDDAGPGIPVEERELVFRKFYRGEASKQQGVRGTGLGLAICREIVVAHGGLIEITSSPLGGARICVSLPGPPTSAREEVAA
jgi:two-component system sensor histidine kinase KdpD